MIKRIVPIIIFSLFIAFNLWASTAITITDLTNNRPYQRTIGGTTADIAISGTYTGDAPDHVEYQVVNSDTHAVVKAWTDITSPTIAGGNWSGTAAGIPQGGLYHIQCRDGVVTTTEDTNNTNAWAVGILVADIGQSLARRLYINDSAGGGTDLTANALLMYYNGSWSHPTNLANAGIAFGNKIIETTGIPVGLLCYAVDGAPLLSTSTPYSVDYGYWLNTAAGAPYPLFQVGAAAVGGIIEFVLYIGSESDAFSGAAEANVEAGLGTLFGRLKTDCGSNVKMLIPMLGRGTDWTDAGFDNVSTAIFNAVNNNPGMYLSTSKKDLALLDNVHLSASGNTTHGQREAQTALYLMGYETYYRGPYPVSIAKVDSTHADITIAHHGGTDFTPASGITGFRIFEGGSARAISAAVRQTATTIRCTTAALGSGTLTFDYDFGENPDVSGAVFDNSPMALPLEETIQEIFDDGESPPNSINAGIRGSGIRMN